MTLSQRAILLLVLALSTSSWAAPSDPPQVVLKLDPCVPVARDEVGRWLALELGEPGEAWRDREADYRAGRLTVEQPGPGVV